ncbi:transcription initiation factor IIF subunit alpha-like [Chenopodium quinoa]|uniref:transcription initiation factor IIF subunit alpha-like n=1 Tax=Chenopodium quinoa TaxID=63459 RepID=UPI000B78DBB5|nr:transcription initiation factor IIF subunit alpha-like [Chenopodium quinoa]
MSFDLMLKPTCGRCGSSSDLYGSNCKHLTLCSNCGKTMAENRAKCFECGTPITRLIREYNVRTNSSNDKNYFIGRFPTGLPNFSKKKSAENKWTLQKEGLQGRPITDTLKEKLKNKPWMLEDETGQSQFQGHLEGAQSATYYLLMMQAKEFVAIPAGSWYNFNKVAQYKQLTLEEAEEKMKNRRKFVDGYERWMMKTASNGAAAFPTFDANLVKDIPTGGGGKGRKKSTAEKEGNASEKGEDEGEEDADRKPKIGSSNGADDDDGNESPAGGDFDDEDDNIEKGDDWEHEEIFTDDDEAVGNDPEEREDLAPEVPAPPEIKQDEDDDEANEEEGGLSKSGKELKKLLQGQANGLNESDRDEEDDSSAKKKKDEEDDDDDDEEDRPSPVLAPKLKDPKDEPADSSPAKPAPGGSSRATPASKSAKGKRKNGDDTKSSSAAPHKKVKTENDVKSAAKENASKIGGAPKVTPPSSTKAGTSTSGTPAQGPVSEEEIRVVLLQKAPVTTADLVATFKSRLKSPEDKKAFAEILKRISKIQKSDNKSYVVLRERSR